MEDKNIITPPPQEMCDLPDYFCGRLIYKDDTDAMCYVVYDGHHKHRFASRPAAEKWCIEQAYTLTEDAVLTLMRSYDHLLKSIKLLRIFLDKYGSTDRMTLEQTCVQMRLTAMHLDRIISTYIPRP